jgi:hypothetical protein
MRARDHADAAVRVLFDTYGPYTPLSAAWRWLGYASLDAARKAHRRGLAPLPLIVLAHRRGLFIATATLATWLDTSFADSQAPREAPEGASVS